jgi:hypothetical protein
MIPDVSVCVPLAVSASILSPAGVCTLASRLYGRGELSSERIFVLRRSAISDRWTGNPQPSKNRARYRYRARARLLS